MILLKVFLFWLASEFENIIFCTDGTAVDKYNKKLNLLVPYVRARSLKMVLI